MTNEIVVPEIKFEVDYKPSTIEIKNEDYLKKLVDEVVKKYGSLVFTEKNIAEAKKTRTELNNYQKMLEDQRKAVKKEYNEPLKVFETKIKGYVKQIDSVNDGIKDGIADYESTQTHIRKQKINELIAEMLEAHDLTENDIQDLEIETSLFTQAAFTKNGKGEPTKKTIETIHNKLGYISLEKKRINDDKKTVREFAELSGLEPYAWESLIDQSFSSADVIKKIKKAVEQKEADKAEQERLRIAKEEYEAAIKIVEKEKQKMIRKTFVDLETGEVVADLQDEVIPNTMTFILEISGTPQALMAMNNFMKKNNISYRKVAK